MRKVLPSWEWPVPAAKQTGKNRVRDGVMVPWTAAPAAIAIAVVLIAAPVTVDSASEDVGI